MDSGQWRVIILSSFFLLSTSILNKFTSYFLLGLVTIGLIKMCNVFYSILVKTLFKSLNFQLNIYLQNIVIGEV